MLGSYETCVVAGEWSLAIDSEFYDIKADAA
jgi:hypothetical protein